MIYPRLSVTLVSIYSSIIHSNECIVLICLSKSKIGMFSSGLFHSSYCESTESLNHRLFSDWPRKLSTRETCVTVAFCKFGVGVTTTDLSFSSFCMLESSWYKKQENNRGCSLCLDSVVVPAQHMSAVP